MRPTFGREYIEDEFQRIAEGLTDPLTVYLIGGGAMSLCDLKSATKDIDHRVQELTDRYYRGLEVLQALDDPMTVDELAAELDLDTDEVRNRVAYLATFDRVRRDDGTVRSRE